MSKTVVYDAHGGLGDVLHALLEREEQGALQSLAEATPVLPDGADPTQAVIAWAMSLAQAITGNPVTWRLMLIPPEGTPDVVREHVQRGRDIALEQARVLAGAVLTRRAELAAIDTELTARSILTLEEEGAKLLLDQPDEFTPERLADYVAAVLTAFRR